MRKICATYCSSERARKQSFVIRIIQGAMIYIVIYSMWLASLGVIGNEVLNHWTNRNENERKEPQSKHS